jgi:hypothetical protein
VSGLTTSRLDAARRQLHTAIELWFADGDAVSIHTLAGAAYQTIHELNRHQKGPDLLFGNVCIREEYRSEFLARMKNETAFFEYANRGKSKAAGSATVDPVASVIFVCMSVFGVTCLNAGADELEWCFMSWHSLHDPKWVADDWRERFLACIPADRLDEIGSAGKSDFLKTFRELWRKARNGVDGSQFMTAAQQPEPRPPAFEDVVRRMLAMRRAPQLAKPALKKRA